MFITPRRLRIFIVILALHRMPNVRSPLCLLLLWLFSEYFSGHSLELIKLPLTIVFDINLACIVLQRLTINASCLRSLRSCLMELLAALLLTRSLILLIITLCLHLNSFFILLVEIFCDEEALLLVILFHFLTYQIDHHILRTGR